MLPIIGSFLILTLIIFLRYVLMSSLFYWIFYRLFRIRYFNKRVNPNPWQDKQIISEMKYSLISSFIFAALGLFMIYAYQEGWTLIYLEVVGLAGFLYCIFTFFLVILLQETYYYWLHRWMHSSPKIYRLIHKVHHNSTVSSPWTSFSFHPIESLLQSILLPILVFIIPMNIGVIVVLLILMTVSATINHLNIEIYPNQNNPRWVGNWLIGATHHAAHHQFFNYNFGLFFTFWDIWMKTEKT